MKNVTSLQLGFSEVGILSQRGGHSVLRGGGEFRSCLFVKTNECKLSVGLRRVLIQIDILLIQPFLPILWPKTVQMAINGPLVAISWPGGSEMADLRGSRLDQVRTHPGGCVGTISRVRNGHWGAHFRIFVFLHFCNFQQKKLKTLQIQKSHCSCPNQ